MGPGTIVMVADNDAGGLSVYAQAGEERGLVLLGLLIALAPVLYIVQEMVARLGAVTGAGHARLIFERFGKRWGSFALADLLVLNLLTIITEFIGVTLALGYFGVNRYLAVPVAALALVIVTSIGSFRRWESTMLLLVLLSLVIVPLAIVSGTHHSSGSYPTLDGAIGRGSGLPLLIVAIVGTSVAPWQLFFQQSNVVDKRITPRWLTYERVDLAIGTVLFVIGAVAVLMTAAVASGYHLAHSQFTDAGRLADALRQSVGPWAGGAFAIALLNGSLLGAAAVTLATSYAIGDVFGTKHSLHRRLGDAPIFYGSFAICLVMAATVVLTPGAPLGLVTLGVQALAGVLLPSATVLLLLLCNDRTVLGPWVNPRWLNIVGALVVGALLGISALLTLALLLPRLDIRVAATLVAVVLGVGLTGVLLAVARSPSDDVFDGSTWERATWSMPPLESLPPPQASRARTLGLVVLRTYLLCAAALVAVRIVQAIAGG